MSENEDAAMPYQPADADENDSGGIRDALAKAESQMLAQPGVRGMGITVTPSGEDAIVVYVENEQVISQLPSTVNGYAVIGEVSGDIIAF